MVLKRAAQISAYFQSRQAKAPFPVTGQWLERCGTVDDYRVCRGGPPCSSQARYVGGQCTRRHDPHSQKGIEPLAFDRSGNQRMGRRIDLNGRLNGNLKIRRASFFQRPGCLGFLLAI